METNKRFVCQSIALYFAECHNLCQCGYMAMWPTLSLQSRLVAAQSIPVKAAASIQIPRVNRWPADRIVLDRIGGVNRRMRGTFGQTTRRMLNYMVMAMWPTLSLQSRLVAAQSIPVKAAASIQIPRVNRWPADRIVLDRIGGVNRRMRGTFGQTTRRMLNYMAVATCWPAIVCC